MRLDWVHTTRTFSCNQTSRGQILFIQFNPLTCFTTASSEPPIGVSHISNSQDKRVNMVKATVVICTLCTRYDNSISLHTIFWLVNRSESDLWKLQLQLVLLLTSSSSALCFSLSSLSFLARNSACARRSLSNHSSCFVCLVSNTRWHKIPSCLI